MSNETQKEKIHHIADALYEAIGQLMVPPPEAAESNSAALIHLLGIQAGLCSAFLGNIYALGKSEIISEENAALLYKQAKEITLQLRNAVEAELASPTPPPKGKPNLRVVH